MSTILEIKELSIGYNQTRNRKLVAESLNGILKKGEMVCLLGANGRGKSTLMKTICGFLKPLSGCLFLNGIEISRLSEKEMAKQIAVVLTEKISAPNATVWELVAYGRSPFTGFLGRLTFLDNIKIQKAIEQCGISHKLHAQLSTLSDGERQKATIAKALAQDTPFIILDEPTAFLDLPARVEIMQLLRQLSSKTGKAILMSTHDLDLALQMSDQLWLLHPKHIIAGSPEDLLLNNAFQSMFNRKGIEFDTKTGIFKVQYQYQYVFPVHGHGFEYVLLRRAFARKGIKLEQCNKEEPMWIDIVNNSNTPFVVKMSYGKSIPFNSVEKLVKYIVESINSNFGNNAKNIFFPKN